jgi:hypothetical protein
VTQQVIRSLIEAPTPKNRGSRTVLPIDEIVSRKGVTPSLVANDSNAMFYGPVLGYRYIVPWIGNWQSRNPFHILRSGSPLARAENLIEPVPHFTYLPFLYQKNGRVMLGVVANGSSGPDLRVDFYFANSFDIFIPHRRILVRT